jgi:putative inorganic carbon (HCO3(-)) transporter
VNQVADKHSWSAKPGREIFTFSVRNYITHYQIKKGFFLLAVVLFAMFVGVLLLQLPARAAFVATGILIFSSLLALYPYVGLFAQIWLYFRPFPIWGGPEYLRPIFLVTVCTITFFLLHYVLIKKARIKFPLECKVASVLLLLMVLSSFFAVHSTGESFSQNLKFLKILAFYFLIVNLVSSKKKFNAFVWFIIICSSIVALQAIRAYRYYGFDRIDNVGGVHSGANFLAAILVLTVPLIFQKLNSRNIYEKIIAIGLTPAFIMGIILTGSRSGTLGLLAVLVLLALRFRRKGLSVVFLALLVLVSLVAAPSHYWTRTKTIADYEQDLSAQSRLDLWEVGFQMFLDHPWTGVGQGNFLWISPQYAQSYSRSWIGQGYVAHNIYIQLLAEGGVQVLLVFLAFVALSFRDLRRARRRLSTLPGGEDLQNCSLGVEIGLIGFLVCGFFLSGAHVDVFYWLLALGPVLYALAEQGQGEITFSGLRKNHLEVPT